ncbi:DUF5666 domain-containing protein [Corallococcus sp. 4LFB]|uniref:DUF5666 domain-containing protein n=1 Tax=Corallococcus sp. 4LFB TaxID=3383249 RepID=UPI003976E964
MALGLGLALPAVAGEPLKAADDTWITLSGKVKSASADAFTLNYGGKDVRIEMDDFDPAAEGFLLKKGDQVTVTGRVDDDLFERAKVEASTVFVKNLDTWFYASPVDEEDTAVAVFATARPLTVVQGKVSGINGREFTIDTGARKITVDTTAMKTNPMQRPGAQKLEQGDRVSVAGTIDRGFFDQRELMASSIVTLSNAGSSDKSGSSTGTGGSGSDTQGESSDAPKPQPQP